MYILHISFFHHLKDILQFNCIKYLFLSGHFLASSLDALNECTPAKFYVAISLYVSTMF